MAKERSAGIPLSEKFDSLVLAKPNFFDEDEDDLTKVDDIALKGNNSDCSAEELDLVQFRKLNIEFLDAEDAKYLGKKSSRLEQAKAFDSDSSDVDGSTDENIDQTQYHRENDRDTTLQNPIGNQNRLDNLIVSGLSSEQSNYGSEMLNVDVIHKSDDVKKGNCIRNQLLMWDLLLECRMKFQNCLIYANQLPKFQNLAKFKNIGGQDFEDILGKNQNSLKHLLNSLLKLQEVLLNKNEDYKKCASKHKMSSDEGESDEDSEGDKPKSKTKQTKLTHFSNEIENRHKMMETFRNETIQKWSDKTRIAHLNSKSFNAFEQSTLKQIEHVLLDKTQLIKRTQIKRSNYHILGQGDDELPSKKIKMDQTTLRSDNDAFDSSKKNNSRPVHTEIFDDDDFYHQLLSEYIKRKYVSDPLEMGKQWFQLQKLRNKMKKKIDARATKGRKIRYVVHQKLVNFMMPIDSTVFSEGSRLELFNSIFGKNQHL